MKRTNFLLVLVVFSLNLASLWASSEIIQREHYTLSYNEDHEIANWVSYELDHKKLENCVDRTKIFFPDPLITTGSSALIDYKGSGFDRGHLLPAGDMKFSQTAMDDTFFLSNVTPQPPTFNRGRWAQLELLIRAWAQKYEKIWIVTGPVIQADLPTIGVENQVSVPWDYFKVILRKTGETYSSVAFLMHTSVPYPSLESYSLDINTIEQMTGQDFFAFLDDESEEGIENQIDTTQWDFTAKFEYFPCLTSEAQSQK